MGGAAVALPALEIMSRPGSASGAGSETPRRFVFMYVGCSAGDNYTQLVQPPTIGPGYELNDALAPLAGAQLAEQAAVQNYRLNVDLDFDSVRDDVNIVSGLYIPWAQTAEEVPPGGRVAAFHGGPPVTPCLSGVRSTARTMRPNGPTCDQVLADEIATEEQKMLGRATLSYRAQPITYYTADPSLTEGRFSWRTSEDGGVTAVEPVVSPRQAYESLFLDLTDPAALEGQLRLLRGRRSVLDLVADSAQRLEGRVSTADRQRLERHYEEIRALEVRLEHLEQSAGQCVAFEHPGDDPPWGEVNTEGVETETNKWSNEEQRARILEQVIQLAFVCDLSRVVMFPLNFVKSYMNMYPVSGQLYDMHGCTHNGATLAADAIGWGVSHFARLVALLRGTPDGDGTLLDHAAVMLTFEGGVGYEPETDLESNSHSTENMSILLAGGAGGLGAGRHIHYENDRHPAQVVLTAMRACGYSQSVLGEVQGELPELYGA
jgi:hypothetical protein